MNIRCDSCKSTNKGRYSTFWSGDALKTLCYECRYGKKAGKSQEQIFNELQTPFWKLMGQKAKPKDIAYEKYLKSRGMTYGDAVKERNYKYGKEKGAYEQFQKTR